MTGRIKRAMKLAAVAFCALWLSACASDKMAQLSTAPVEATVPPQGQSTMVFFRSSYFGGAIQSSVFDVTDAAPKFIGIVSAGKKIAYAMPAGERRMMAIGENASFLDVEAEAGKIYYARISPRMGLWKARFELEPVPVSEAGIKDEVAECEWVGNTDASLAWANQNVQSINSKMIEYLPDFENNPNRAKLLAGDGG